MSPSSISFSISFILLKIMSLLLLVSQGSHASCNTEDKKILLSIKAAFGNPPELSYWNKSVGCCKWTDITCDTTTGRIRNLTISSLNISGQIPPEIGNLTTLYYIVLSDLPGVTGPLPESLVNIPQLYQLTVSGTALSGAVPAVLGDLIQIGMIRFPNNRLTGPIPAAVASLPNLFELTLGGNFLTGTIPDYLFRGYDNNPNLDLSNNLFTGVIPPALGNVDFDVINLSDNSFVGNASFLFNTSKAASLIDLSRNHLSFDMTRLGIPTTRLAVLNVSHNNLTGDVPTSITGDQYLETLDVSYNQLCGKIPTGGPMAKFNASSYAHNKCLCGTPLPRCSSS